MDTSRILIGLALGGLILTGCKKDPEKTSETTPPPATAPSSLLNPATSGPSLTVTPTIVPPTTSPSIITPPGGETPAPGAADADAKILLTEVSVDLADKKWDAASAALKKLNDMRPTLSQEKKDAVMTAEQKYLAAKATSSSNLTGTGSPATQPAGIEANK